MYEKLNYPKNGTKITVEAGQLKVPDDPIIPFIRGDGIGPDIWAASQRVFDACVEKAYSGKKKIVWLRIYAGLDALQLYGDDQVLPDETIKAIQDHYVAIKGPLTTPVGGFEYVCLVCAAEQNGENGDKPKKCVKCGSEWVTPRFRSLNVGLRQKMDLYACVRPVRWFHGVPSPVKHPENLNITIFRENTEDVYSGIEFQQGTDEAKEVIDFLNSRISKPIRPDSGIGVKPISITGSKRLARKAIQYAIQHKLSNVTLVHKGNIMKFTEGAFRDWGYELAKEEFRDHIVTEKELWDDLDGKMPEGKILIKDRIADSIFQQVLLRPGEYDVLATPNLNGDYLSDACAAQVGGLGLAPGANMADYIALFEATHGTAPKYTGQDKVNPSSVILSGVMMLEYMGWQEAADMVVRAIKKTIDQKRVTYDLERQMEGAEKLKTSQFADAIIENM
ncbi:MAG: isocitrate dehydrogenase (NADP(+)) [Candidatus Cloacimonetes bacterium 4572_55]|nr:MAG: isocitrate dehydrogenase (NADP(+)) [Candidatus Cloacimonetes bacterium 4572_55]